MCGRAECEVGATFTYIIENLVEVCGVHDEVGISHHVVDCVCLRSNRREAAGRLLLRQAALFPPT